MSPNPTLNPRLSSLQSPSSILILGAGVFGLSTALSLLHNRRYSSTRIIVLDASAQLPNPSSSSVDSSRIIRADYASAPYAALALSAQRLWRNSSKDSWGGEGRYHEPGFLLTTDKGRDAYVKQCMVNVRALAEQGVGLDVSQIKELFDQDAIRRASRYSGVSGDSGYVNWGSGWADAEACVAYALQRLRTEGEGRVEIRSNARVERLLYDGTSRCIGAELDSGEQVLADLTMVACGAWSPTLVNLQGRAVATGQALSYLEISKSEQLSMADRPTIMNMSRGMFIIPPRNRELKVARHGYGYRNLRRIRDPDPHWKGGEIEVSVPEAGIAIPLEAEEACREALRELVPEMAERPFSRTRICWYTDTPSGDFIIDHHPFHPGLFVATGGSGHGFKFFPVIGDKIVAAIEGKLEPELQQLWRWREEPVQGLMHCDDGSRSGPKGMILDDEIARRRP